MLDRFSVKSFKSLADVTVHPGVINVFIGANGSGKSNLLEAIGILGAAASGRVHDESLKHRGVRPGRPALYKSSFKNAKLPVHVRFEAEGSGASYSVSLLNPIEKPMPEWAYKHEKLMRGTQTVFGRGPHSYERLNDAAGFAALKAVELPAEDPASRLLGILQNYAIYAPDTPTLRGLEPDPQSREPVGLAGGKLPEGVTDLQRNHSLRSQLTEILPLVDWILTLGVSLSYRLPISDSVPQQQRSLRFVDRFMSEKRNILSGYDASEGVLYLLFCSVLALHPNAPRLFAVDNFDQALNPRVAREFTRVFCDWLLAAENKQVLLTTHNPLVLDGLPLRDDRVRLFAVDRSKRGHTVVNRVHVTDAVESAADKGMPLSQQWVMGHFGGVPSGV
jgi:predicted ATPase